MSIFSETDIRSKTSGSVFELNFFRLYNLQYVFKNLEKKDNDYEKIDYDIMNLCEF